MKEWVALIIVGLNAIASVLWGVKAERSQKAETRAKEVGKELLRTAPLLVQSGRRIRDNLRY